MARLDIPCYYDDEVEIFYPQGRLNGVLCIETRENKEPFSRNIQINNSQEATVFSYLANIHRYGKYYYLPLHQFYSLCDALPVSHSANWKVWKSFLKTRVWLELNHFYPEVFWPRKWGKVTRDVVKVVIDALGLTVANLEQRTPLVQNAEAERALKEWAVSRYIGRMYENFHLRKRSNTSYRKKDGMYLISVPSYFTDIEWQTLVKHSETDFTKAYLFTAFDGFETTSASLKMRIDMKRLYPNKEMRDEIMETNGYQVDSFWEEDGVYQFYFEKDQFFRICPINALGLWNQCQNAEPYTEEIGTSGHPLSNAVAAYRFDNGYIRLYQKVSKQAAAVLFLIGVSKDEFEITPERTRLRISFFERFHSDFFIAEEELVKQAVAFLEGIPDTEGPNTHLWLTENKEFTYYQMAPSDADWAKPLLRDLRKQISLGQAMERLADGAITAFRVAAVWQSLSIYEEGKPFVPIHNHFEVITDPETGYFVIDNFD